MWLLDLLAEHQILTLFTVLLLGYLIGGLRVAGFSLGVAGVLFAGLLLNALNPEIKLDSSIYELGLALFVYAIALASGVHFVQSLNRTGLVRNLLVLAALGLGAGLTLLLGRMLELPAALTAGLFTGALTNTPALATVIAAAGGRAELGDPVVAYSIAYPMGVIGLMLAMFAMQRVFRPDIAAEAKALNFANEELVSRSVLVAQTQPLTIEQLQHERHWRVVFGRVSHAGHMELAHAGDVLEAGDIVSVVGAPADVAEVVAALGSEHSTPLEADRSVLDFRRIFVSSKEVAGRTLADLNMNGNYGALVTRVRRGDRDIVPDGKTVLELGDRVRVVAPRERMGEITRALGDSYRQLSEIDLKTFSLGLVLALLVGSIPLPLPGGTTFTLGVAGGPLVVGLLLGALERTGPLVWNIPYSANLTLRQFGLAIFLAGVGLRSGSRFAEAIVSAQGLYLFLAGTAVTLTAAFFTLAFGYRVLKIPFSLLTGVLSGVGTHPAVLAYAGEKMENEVPEIGYASVYPAAMLGKILLAQLIFMLAGAGG